MADNTVEENYVDTDHACCANGGGPSSLCGTNRNVVRNNWLISQYPTQAQAVAAAAGLESAYLYLKQPMCGNATCESGETATSCAKDCK
jgi:hypothetical protein